MPKYIANIIFTFVISLLFLLPTSYMVVRSFAPTLIGYKKPIKPPVLNFKHIYNGQGVKGKIKGVYLDATYNIKVLYEWYIRKIGLKKELLKMYQFIKEDILNTNPFPNKVIKGRIGWLFLGDDFENALSISLGIKRFNKKQIKNITRTITSHYNWCNQRGIKYYFMLVPGKHDIYSEYLPFDKPDQPTTYDMLSEALALTQIPFVDSREALISGKSKQLYYKEDTHWNGHGAWIAYLQLMDSIGQDFPFISGLSHREVFFDSVFNGSGDLAKFLNRRSPFPKISAYPVVSNAKIMKKQLKVPAGYNTSSPNNYEYRFRNRKGELKVLVFRDSYFTALQTLIPETFGSNVLIWDPKMDTNIIIKEQPDIVIQEVAERMIKKFYLINRALN
ncbi:MAG: hypothetical protein DRI89_00090 [Bacteroidetes bacterium]|nr:MAG: hypothetical protein DRI89_00090 [Bacteroidota bacterium]